MLFNSLLVSFPLTPKSRALAITIGIDTSRQVTSTPSILIIGSPVGNNLPVAPPTIFLNFNKIGEPDPGTPAILNSPEYLIFLLGVGISASIIDLVLTDLITILVSGSVALIIPLSIAKGPTADSIFPHVGP